MDVLLHPPDDACRHRPSAGGRLSTAGHATAFRAARAAGIRFMVIGGTFRHVAVRAASTRDIDIVLIDRQELPADVLRAAGFVPVPGARDAWRYTTRGRIVDLEVAAAASSRTAGGQFSIAFQQAERTGIAGIKVAVPRIEDYVI